MGLESVVEAVADLAACLRKALPCLRDAALHERTRRETGVVGEAHHLILAFRSSRETIGAEGTIEIARPGDADRVADAQLPVTGTSPRVGLANDAAVEWTFELVAQAPAVEGTVGAKAVRLRTSRARFGAGY